MAIDYTGMFTGERPNPSAGVAGMPRDLLGQTLQGIQQGEQRARQGLGQMMGKDLRSSADQAREQLSQVDIKSVNTPEGLLKLAQLKQAMGDTGAAMALASEAESLRQRTDIAPESVRNTRQAIAEQLKAAGYLKMAEAVIKEQGSGSELVLAGAIKVLTNLAQPAKPRNVLTPEEQVEVFRAEESFKADLKIAQGAEERATEQSSQYLPILQQMNELTETVDFGPTSTAISTINSTLYSLADKAGLNPEPLDPSADATLTYNSLSKRLKAWLLESQKGAISNLENTEITKNTANPNMTKNQAKALVNFSEASLISANNKAQEQKQWLQDTGSLIGFEKAWGKYVEDFPRTEGFLTVTDPSGSGSSVQANFKPIKGNMELFSLYATNKGNSPTFVTKEGKGFTVEDIKKELIQDRLDEMKLGNPDFVPTKEQLSLYKLNARRKVGSLISLRLKNSTYTVTK